MITQAEAKKYAEIKNLAKDAEVQFKAIREALIPRVKAGEDQEKGALALAVKTFDKTSTSYKSVVEGIAAYGEGNQELLDQIAALLKEHSETKEENRLDILAQEEVVVIKKRKVA